MTADVSVSEAFVHDVKTDATELRVLESFGDGPDDLKSKCLPQLDGGHVRFHHRVELHRRVSVGSSPGERILAERTSDTKSSRIWRNKRSMACGNRTPDRCARNSRQFGFVIDSRTQKAQRSRKETLRLLCLCVLNSAGNDKDRTCNVLRVQLPTGKGETSVLPHSFVFERLRIHIGAKINRGLPPRATRRVAHALWRRLDLRSAL